MSAETIYQHLLRNLPYTPTPDQEILLQLIAQHLFRKTPRKLFILKGYAGTGKTTAVAALVKTVAQSSLKTVLMAPTGRAAKVLSSYTGEKALTIHRKIYRVRLSGKSGPAVIRARNMHRNTLFIVDEASMIGGENATQDSFFSRRNLLDDLIDYVYSGNNCQLLLVGDSAQLPPVGSDQSPALNINYLKARYHLNINSFELKQVVRQEAESAILKLATEIRNRLYQNRQFSIPRVAGPEIGYITGEELQEILSDSLNTTQPPECVVITRSNKRANLFNEAIRQRILFRENEIGAGDILMVVKNNYFWLDENDPMGFIANGDLAEVRKVIRTHELYGFRFAQVVIEFPDFPDTGQIETVIMLDTLTIEQPSLGQEQYREFYEAVKEDYADLLPAKQAEEVRKNRWFNALQVKFAWSLTCHKTQGGQWPVVIIDPGYLRKEHLDESWLRWLYTAVTRATDKLFILNFPEWVFDA